MSLTEIILIVLLVLVLLTAKGLPSNVVQSSADWLDEFLLWVAQGFGLGRIPVAPGTFGSVLGVFWFELLLATGSFWALVIGTIAGLGVSVWLCGIGERLLGKKDPGSVVLDEIAAMPICFFSWVLIQIRETGSLPEPGYFLSGRCWPLTLVVFALFRLFDVTKPWPVRQSQALPGGWGITIDDALAALYVNGVVLLAYEARTLI